MPTYLIYLGQGEMLALADGDDAADAVGQYYADLDAYCPPLDELAEKTTVLALLVADELADELCELLAETDDGTPAAVDAILAAHGRVLWTTLDAVLANGEWTVSERP